MKNSRQNKNTWTSFKGSVFRHAKQRKLALLTLMLELNAGRFTNRTKKRAVFVARISSLSK